MNYATEVWSPSYFNWKQQKAERFQRRDTRWILQLFKSSDVNCPAKGDWSNWIWCRLKDLVFLYETFYGHIDMTDIMDILDDLKLVI